MPVLPGAPVHAHLPGRRVIDQPDSINSVNRAFACALPLTAVAAGTSPAATRIRRAVP